MPVLRPGAACPVCGKALAVVYKFSLPIEKKLSLQFVHEGYGPGDHDWIGEVEPMTAMYEKLHTEGT